MIPMHKITDRLMNAEKEKEVRQKIEQTLKPLVEEINITYAHETEFETDEN